MGMFGFSWFLECGFRFRHNFQKSKSGLFLCRADGEVALEAVSAHPSLATSTWHWDFQCFQSVVQEQIGRVEWRPDMLMLALMALRSVMATVLAG